MSLALKICQANNPNCYPQFIQLLNDIFNEQITSLYSNEYLMFIEENQVLLCQLDKPPIKEIKQIDFKFGQILPMVEILMPNKLQNVEWNDLIRLGHNDVNDILGLNDINDYLMLVIIRFLKSLMCQDIEGIDSSHLNQGLTALGYQPLDVKVTRNYLTHGLIFEDKGESDTTCSFEDVMRKLANLTNTVNPDE